MAIKTVAELKEYLTATGLSPERLGKEVGISNMTLRRILARTPETTIPSRYQLALSVHQGDFGPASDIAPLPQFTRQEFAPLLEDLKARGTRIRSTTKLRHEVKAMALQGPVQFLRPILGKLLDSLKNKGLSKQNRLIVIGALLYFVDPFDLVPDVMPGVGFLDDFAVLALVCGIIGKVVGEMRAGNPSPPIKIQQL